MNAFHELQQNLMRLALTKSGGKVSAAYELNYPKRRITYNAYVKKMQKYNLKGKDYK